MSSQGLLYLSNKHHYIWKNIVLPCNAMAYATSWSRCEAVLDRLGGHLMFLDYDAHLHFVYSLFGGAIGHETRDTYSCIVQAVVKVNCFPNHICMPLYSCPGPPGGP